MKYNQPFGISDPNAPYINGNPSTGTMGSIPPAASIEHPQREIVNFITDSAFTPNEADLRQLAKGIQSGRVIYAVDYGIPNTLLINVTPALDAYKAGQQWNVRVLNENTGASTININSLGPRNIVLRDGNYLKGGELAPGAIVALIDDGTNLQLQGVGSFGAFLTGNKDYYVNGLIGDDTLYDGTTPTVMAGTSHGPVRTVQRAISITLLWNMNGYAVTIHVSGGASGITYPPFECLPLNGSGGCMIIGDTASPEKVHIHATTGEAIMIFADQYQIHGMKVTSDANGSSPNLGAGIRLYGANSAIARIEFGACSYAHMLVQSSSTLIMIGAVSQDPSSYFIVSGDAPVHMFAAQNSLIFIALPIMTVVAGRSIPIWAQATTTSTIENLYAVINPTGSAPNYGVTGKKYEVTMNGTINTGGGVSYFPGNLPGTKATGGQDGT